MKNAKPLFHLSWATSLYIVLLSLDKYFFQSGFVIIGFVREMFTIPLLLIQVGLFIWPLYSWAKYRNIEGYALWTLVITLINTIFVICALTIKF